MERRSVADKERFTVQSIRVPGFVVGCWGLLIVAGEVRADTVHLKNGAYIDGIVTARNDRVIMITIGRIGKLEISVDDVSRVEKNSRTGARDRVPVDSRSLAVSLPTWNERPEDADNEAAESEELGDDDLGEAEDEEAEDASESEEVADDSDSSNSVDKKEKEEELEPKVKEEIEQAAKDLQRQRSQFRWRAERKLRAIGKPAVPFLVPLAAAENELTRTIVMRFFSEYADDDTEVIEACLDTLGDDSVYVRGYAVQALRRLTKQNFGFRPKSSSRARARGRENWSIWWKVEKLRREAESEKRGDETMKKAND